jgi:hypothetical protein
MEPVDMFWGDGVYGALNLEGHPWSFAQHTKDVVPEDMKLPADWISHPFGTCNFRPAVR